jgi:transposase
MSLGWPACRTRNRSRSDSESHTSSDCIQALHARIVASEIGASPAGISVCARACSSIRSAWTRPGLKRDYQAVLNGLTLPYSSGKVEGNVNRIKMLKRQMYGRARFDLLRKRVLLA